MAKWTPNNKSSLYCPSNPTSFNEDSVRDYVSQFTRIDCLCPIKHFFNFIRNTEVYEQKTKKRLPEQVGAQEWAISTFLLVLD